MFRSLCITLLLHVVSISSVYGEDAHPKDTRPNFLFITTDYTRGVDLPVTGAPFLNAPTLEKLCREGAVFTRHGCVAPICAPSRATIATGVYPHVHNLWDNRSIPVRKPGRAFLIEDLNQLGYQTLGIGKMHWSPQLSDFNYDVRISLEGKDVAREVGDDYDAFLANHGWSRERISRINKHSAGYSFPRGQSFYPWPLREELHPDAFVGSQALEKVQNNALACDQPWFMWVSFTGPHNPWNVPKRLATMYMGLQALPDAKFVQGELDQKPLDYTRHRYGYGGDLFGVYDQMSTAEKKIVRHNVRAAHYANLTFIDEWIGKLVAALDERDQLENTIIFFSSDHGSALFDNEMLHKGASLPTQSLVPFVVWRPGLVTPGLRTGFSSHADVYATLMDLADNEHPAETQGTSLVPMLLSPEMSVHDFNVIECCLVTSIMTDRWLAGFHHVSHEIDLYDLDTDPMCHVNLAALSEHAATIEDLKQKLVAWRKQIGPHRELVDDDPLAWDGKLLGDPSHVAAYRNGYLRGYEKLAELPDDRPGRTGRAARLALERIQTMASDSLSR